MRFLDAARLQLDFIDLAHVGPGDLIIYSWLTTQSDEDETAWDRLWGIVDSISGASITELVKEWCIQCPIRSIRPMSLLEALALLPSDKEDSARAALDRLAEAGPRSRAMVKSLFAEQQLNILQWAHLLELLHDHPGKPMEGLRAWGAAHRFEGAICSAHMPLGRVIEKNTFVRSLMTHARLPRQVARDTLVDLCSTTQWVRARDACSKRSFMLGGPIMWATFASGGGDPFDFAATVPDRGHFIKASLGLERDPVPQRRYLPVLLIRYVTTTECHTPSCADASSYEDWNIYFAPAVHRCPGLTQPWDEGDRDLQPRPEVVHAQVDASALVAPIEEVR